MGDFEYVEAKTERKYNGVNIPVRVYTTRGLKEQARFAAGYAHRIIDYFSEIFQIDYPLPKSDLLAVHEFVSPPLSPSPLLFSFPLTSFFPFFFLFLHLTVILIFRIGQWSYGELGSGDLQNHCCSLRRRQIGQ